LVIPVEGRAQLYREEAREPSPRRFRIFA